MTTRGRRARRRAVSGQGIVRPAGDPPRSAVTERTRQGLKRRLGPLGKFLRFPWSLVFLIVAIAAFLVFMPISIFEALAAAGGDWNARLPAGRLWTHATISQVAFAGIPFSLILVVFEVGLIRMLPTEVRQWRSRMRARGRHTAE